MDLVLVRTFLEVAACGSFSAASERLNVTQSTVSARVKALEDRLGRPVFMRNKGGTALTMTGQQFQRHATQILRSWEHACQDIAIPEGFTSVLRVGSEAGLWMRLLHQWIPWMQHHVPQVALRIEAGTPDVLMLHLIEGTHDMGVTYAPQSRPGLKVDLLVEEDLLLVKTPEINGAPAGGAPAPGYVYVDWGREFRIHHQASYPDFQMPGLLIGIGTLAFKHVINIGGSGYFPRSLVNNYIARGDLDLVDGAPLFSLPIYVVYPVMRDEELFDTAITGLRETILPACMNSGD
ncbi:LysR family transcriptional regulator [Ferruginivarius sediminum]|uniref:LysR family transcriptional regulator n=1 Tax=Ferruginivarius sediminum TaxID=2661937 RepID=A0A369T615_9PROT|nr:LysR family transcriptional regulator [Ferruginivarius sediminum]RDD60760.1 LysR family transcriptional regulator [Ferruginivarius sediminum]